MTPKREATAVASGLKAEDAMPELASKNRAVGEKPSAGAPVRTHEAGREPSIAKPGSREARPETRIERIARRAHEIYEARGGEHGKALEDWLQAEREIDAEMEDL
jgi:hypothetical protein